MKVLLHHGKVFSNHCRLAHAPAGGSVHLSFNFDIIVLYLIKESHVALLGKNDQSYVVHHI